MRKVIYEDWMETKKYKLQLLRVDMGTEFPHTEGAILIDKKTNLYSYQALEVPEDEYGHGSIPGRVVSFVEKKKRKGIKIKYTFIQGARMSWHDKEFECIIPKPYMSKKMFNTITTIFK